MTKVKICGITNQKDAEGAFNLGADYLGFNFYRQSPRFIEKTQAKKIIEIIPKKAKIVGIFVNDSIESIKDAVEFCNLDLAQVSGDEDEGFVSKLKKAMNKKIIKSFRIGKNLPHGKIFSVADYVLLDSFKDGAYGGTGKIFDWGMAWGIDKKKLFLSGGLKADNVGRAIYEVNPFCVDVCSGVEKSPGKKDFSMMKEFINSVKNSGSKRAGIF